MLSCDMLPPFRARAVKQGRIPTLNLSCWLHIGDEKIACFAFNFADFIAVMKIFYRTCCMRTRRCLTLETLQEPMLVAKGGDMIEIA